MKIGIMGAMEQEIGLLRRNLEKPKHEMHGKRQYTSGLFRDREVVTVFSRWGKVAAASTATTLIERYGVDMIIFTGVAGAADPSLEIGDIVVASETVQHDMDVSALPGFERFEIPLLGKSHFPVDERFIRLGADSASRFVNKYLNSPEFEQSRKLFGVKEPSVSTGLIASGDSFVSDTQKIHSLANELPGLKCVEMEGAAVAQVCYEHQIPMILLRVISDKANHDAVIDFPAFIEKIACPMTCGVIEELIEWV